VKGFRYRLVAHLSRGLHWRVTIITLLVARDG
jgi:hypothetical protein